MGTCCAPEKKHDPVQPRAAPAEQPAAQQQFDVQEYDDASQAYAKGAPDGVVQAPRSSKEWYSLSNGDKYKGEWTEAHTIHGFGIYCYQLSGFKYEGEFDTHERHGYGIFTYENPNHRYEGHWDKGRRHGRGSYRMTDFSHYVGEFRDDLMHGRGVWQSPPPSSEYYDGEWMQGTKHGHGINVDTQEGLFAGHFNKGDRAGCAYYISDGVTRVGRWQGDYLHGPGIEWSPGLFVFIGSFDSGKREGAGTLFFVDGSDGEGKWNRFVGTWSDTRVTGPGARFFADGSGVFAEEWDETANGTRILPRAGQVKLSAEDVEKTFKLVLAAGGYELPGGHYGTFGDLASGFRQAPGWVPPNGADTVRTCLDDPAIQQALTISAALSRPSVVVKPGQAPTPSLETVLTIPYVFAFLSPPPMPQPPKALIEADTQLRVNEIGLQVTPEELGRPPHIAAKLAAG